MQLSLSQLPWYAQIGAFVVVCALSAFGFYHFYAVDVQAELVTKQARLDQLRGDINRGLTTARRLPEFQSQVGDLQIRLQALESILPEQKDYAEVLRRLQTLATQSSLTIQAFVPQPAVTQQIHASWPFKLTLEGTYHNLGLFFDKVSKFPRLINISGVTIKARPQQQENATIIADCTATTFVLLENPVAEAPAAAPGARGAAAKPPAPAAAPVKR